MCVEHVPGGGGAAYAFLQLDDFPVFVLLCGLTISFFSSPSLSNTISSLSGIQFATLTVGVNRLSLGRSETVKFVARHTHPVLEESLYCDLLEINGCCDAE